MFIWIIFYFIAWYPFSGHWEKPCLSLFLPIKYLCTLTRSPWAFSLTRMPIPALSASSPIHHLYSPSWTHSSTSVSGLYWEPQCCRCGLTSAEQRGRGKPHLPWAALPKAAQDPVGILGKQSPGGVSSRCFCVTSLKLGALTWLHQRESENLHQCFNYLLKMRQWPLK